LLMTQAVHIWIHEKRVAKQSMGLPGRQVN